MDFEFDIVAWMPQLLAGLWVTIEITVLCVGMGIVLGLALMLLRLYGHRPFNWLAVVYIDFFRGVPVLVQLFLVYYGLPTVGVDFSPFTAGVLTLGLNTAAYQAEYFRGAIQSLPAGQSLAARSIGMTHMQSIRWILLPQALRLVIPPWSNELILMLKYSSIVFFATVTDLMGAGKIIASETFRYFEVFLVVAFMYLALVVAISWALRWLESRVRVPGLGSAGMDT